MSGKLVSLFDHPEFVRRVQEREERKLADRVVPVVRLGYGRLLCRRCSLEFETMPRVHAPTGPSLLDCCPHCEPEIDVDALEAFLNEVLGEPGR